MDLLLSSGPIRQHDLLKMTEKTEKEVEHLRQRGSYLGGDLIHAPAQGGCQNAPSDGWSLLVDWLYFHYVLNESAGLSCQREKSVG